MAERNTARRSHCEGCGKRLSVKTSSGTIKWQPSRVDDIGIYCLSCASVSKSVKERKTVPK